MENKRITYRILLFMTALLVMACTNDPQEESMEPGNRLGMVAMTRSIEPFTVTDDYSPIGVFLVDVSEPVPETQSGRFVYRSGENLWKSSIEVTPNHNYAIYGYAPADAVTATISTEPLDGATLTSLTFTNLPAVSSQDICFVVGVQQLETTATPKDIPLGSFSFTGKSADNYANLLMDHVYAAVCFQMTIGAEYSQLRSIKIRKLELQTTKATATATVVLASNTTNKSPVQSATYTDLTGTQSSAIFFDDTEGVALDATTLTEATCCFVPGLASELKLITTYDVYDKEENKVSERTATNKLPNLNAARGQRVKLTLKVEPTYLYVLSDPDLDNPTIEVKSE